MRNNQTLRVLPGLCEHIAVCGVFTSRVGMTNTVSPSYGESYVQVFLITRHLLFVWARCCLSPVAQGKLRTGFVFPEFIQFLCPFLFNRFLRIRCAFALHTWQFFPFGASSLRFVGMSSVLAYYTFLRSHWHVFRISHDEWCTLHVWTWCRTFFDMQVLLQRETVSHSTQVLKSLKC